MMIIVNTVYHTCTAAHMCVHVRTHTHTHTHVFSYCFENHEPVGLQVDIASVLLFIGFLVLLV